MLAEKLGFLDTEIVDPTYSESLYKLVVFSPTTHAEVIRQAFEGARSWCNWRLRRMQF